MSSSSTMCAPKKSCGWSGQTFWSRAKTIVARSSTGKSSSSPMVEASHYGTAAGRARAPRRHDQRRCAHSKTAPDDSDESAKFRQTQRIREAQVDRAESGNHQQRLHARSGMGGCELDRECNRCSEKCHSPKLREKFSLEPGPADPLIEFATQRRGEILPTRQFQPTRSGPQRPIADGCQSVPAAESRTGIRAQMKIYLAPARISAVCGYPKARRTRSCRVVPSCSRASRRRIRPVPPTHTPRRRA